MQIKFTFNDVLSVHVDNIFGNCENVCQSLIDWPVKWSEGGQVLGLGELAICLRIFCDVSAVI